MNARIIDVSKHNVVTDWTKVKAAGISGVIIRAGYGRIISQKDKTFENYYTGAVKAGLHVGAYWYSYAKSAAEAKTEAAVFIEAIKGKRFDLPVYFDIEEQDHVALGKTICTAMVEAFCGAMEVAGYFAGVYSFDSFFATNLSEDIQKKYTCWVARVENVQPKCCKTYGMHQYTWKGSVSGISGAVDVSYGYKDFSAIIKGAGLNGYEKADTYKVTAEIGGVTSDKAGYVAASCKSLGMNVTKVKE